MVASQAPLCRFWHNWKSPDWHQFGGDGKEVRVVGKMATTLARQAEIGLTHQCGRGPGVTRTLPGKAASGPAMEFLVNDRKEASRASDSTLIPNGREARSRGGKRQESCQEWIELTAFSPTPRLFDCGTS